MQTEQQLANWQEVEIKLIVPSPQILKQRLERILQESYGINQKSVEQAGNPIAKRAFQLLVNPKTAAIMIREISADELDQQETRVVTIHDLLSADPGDDSRSASSA